MTRASTTAASWVLAGLCLAATTLVVLLPETRHILGNDASSPAARLLTSPFVHGFSRASAVPHLAGNLLLLGLVGRRVERQLGSARFCLLTVGALLVYAGIQLAFWYDVNGASVFIWAYGPPLATARTNRDHARTVLLIVMWLVIPVAMTTVPYASGWSGSLVGAFLVANTFHLAATGVGAGAVWLWSRENGESA